MGRINYHRRSKYASRDPVSTFWEIREQRKASTAHVSERDTIHEACEYAPDRTDNKASISLETRKTRSGSVDDIGEPGVASTPVHEVGELGSDSADEAESIYYEASEIQFESAVEHTKHSTVIQEASKVDSECTGDDLSIYMAGDTEWESTESTSKQGLASINDDLIEISSQSTDNTSEPTKLIDEADELGSNSTENTSEYRDTSINEVDEFDSNSTEDASEYRDTSINGVDGFDSNSTEDASDYKDNSIDEGDYVVSESSNNIGVSI